ncbi:cytochrome oxidase subunit I, partial [Listeria innocua FSL S4-378]
FILLVIIASTLFALNIISSVGWMASVFCLVIVAIIFTNMTKKRT